MKKDKKVGINLMLTESRYAPGRKVINARVTYERKTTNFLLYSYGNETKKLNETVLEKLKPEIIKKITDAVRCYANMENNFSIKGFSDKYHIIYEDFYSWFCFQSLMEIRKELGDLLTYNQFRSIPDAYIIDNEFYRPGATIYEEFDDGFLIIPKLNEVRKKFDKDIFNKLSKKSASIAFVGLMLDEFIRIKSKRSIIHWFIDNNTREDFFSFYQKRKEKGMNKYNIKKESIYLDFNSLKLLFNKRTSKRRLFAVVEAENQFPK